MITDMNAFFYGLRLAVKTELCFIINNYGILEVKLTFKGFLDTQRIQISDTFFKLEDKETTIGDFARPWKNLFGHGRTIDKKESTIKEFKYNVNETK